MREACDVSDARGRGSVLFRPLDRYTFPPYGLSWLRAVMGDGDADAPGECPLGVVALCGCCATVSVRSKASTPVMRMASEPRVWRERLPSTRRVTRSLVLRGSRRPSRPSRCCINNHR